MDAFRGNGATRGGSIDNNNGSRSTPRIRSRVACQGCNRRKVRCDVAQTSRPCSNCQRDGGSCVILPRKKHRPRRKRDDPSMRQDQGDQAFEDEVRPGDAYGHQASAQGLTGPLTTANSTVMRNDLSTEDDHDQFDTAGSQDENILPEDSSFTYIGDRRGPRHSVYDLCHPGTPQEARPYLPAKDTTRLSFKPHQVEYMRSQGVFTTLPSDICDDMIRCYFRHVHFFLPVVDAADVLNEYHREGSQKVNGLLFWSMLLAAANFADADLLKRAGYSSRKAMKMAMYERAKCLYDLDRTTDKLKLIQSVLLLSFWYTDSQDHTGAWYWIGVAITLSQSIGLHRSPRSASRAQQSSPARQALTRRIWWTCLVRDRWVSLAKGRPMRIHSEDCDTPIPSQQDVLDELALIVNDARVKFIPVDSIALTSLWLRLVNISDILGGILRLHYRVNGPDPSITEIDKYAQELQSLVQSNSTLPDGRNDSLSIHTYQIELFYQATIAILYRPYALNESTSLPSGSPENWQKMALRRARDAASNTNNLMQNLIELDAIKYLKPMMYSITAIIPAMQIHLSDCKSTNSLTKGLARNKLQLCMLVLSNLRVTYWSADVMYRLFERAQAILSKADVEELKPAKNSSTQLNPAPATHNNGNIIEMESNVQPQHSLQIETPLLPTPDPNLINEEAQSLWSTVSPQFSNVDQLLSPGFSLSEDVYLDFFPGYDGRVYGQHMPMTGKASEDVMYTNLGF